MGSPGDGRGFELTLHPDHLDQPLERDKPTVYFVGSMADLFHEDVPDPFIDRVLAVAHRTPWYTDLWLTQHAARLPAFFANRPVPPNVWLGVTVEDRRHGLPRIDRLRRHGPGRCGIGARRPAWRSSSSRGARGAPMASTAISKLTVGCWRGGCGASGRN